MYYEHLLSPGSIGGLYLKNRVVMPAMGVNLSNTNGEATEVISRYYEERAKGGVGLIITEIARIDEEYGVGTPNQLSVTEGRLRRKGTRRQPPLRLGSGAGARIPVWALPRMLFGTARCAKPRP